MHVAMKSAARAAAEGSIGSVGVGPTEPSPFVVASPVGVVLVSELASGPPVVGPPLDSSEEHANANAPMANVTAAKPRAHARCIRGGYATRAPNLSCASRDRSSSVKDLRFLSPSGLVSIALFGSIIVLVGACEDDATSPSSAGPDASSPALDSGGPASPVTCNTAGVALCGGACVST